MSQGSLVKKKNHGCSEKLLSAHKYMAICIDNKFNFIPHVKTVLNKIESVLRNDLSS